MRLIIGILLPWLLFFTIGRAGGRDYLHYSPVDSCWLAAGRDLGSLFTQTTQYR
jgi:hypothetical protein